MTDSKPSLDPYFKFHIGEFVRSAGDSQEPVSIERELLGVASKLVVRFQITDRRVVEFEGGIEVSYDVRGYLDGLPRSGTMVMAEVELAHERVS